MCIILGVPGFKGAYHNLLGCVSALLSYAVNRGL